MPGYGNNGQAQGLARSDEKCRNRASSTRRLVVALIETQLQHGGHFAMYGNPLWWTWDGRQAPEFKKYYQAWYLTEFRWCNMGIFDPKTGQGFGSKTRVLSSVPL